MPNVSAKKKRKSKGKRHPAHATSFDHIAKGLKLAGQYAIAAVFEKEAKRLRGIVR